MKEQYGPWALIAGGSEGIGMSYAEKLAAQGINLVLLARREAPLKVAREKLKAAYSVEVETYSVDLTGDDLESRLDAIIADKEVGLLIYNAGATHGAELLHDAPLSSATNLVALNCNGPLVFCHKLGAAMRERGRGGIILMSSMSGLVGGGYIAAYTATKAFDLTLAEALYAELKPYNVDVLCLIAGATDTPAMAASGVTFNAGEGAGPMASDDVAEEGLSQLGKVPVWVAGEGNRAFADILRSPDRAQAIDMMTAGAAGLYDKPFPITR